MKLKFKKIVASGNQSEGWAPSRNRFTNRLLLVLACLCTVAIVGAVSYAFFTSAGRSNPLKANLSTAKLALRFADNDNGFIPTTIAFGETVTKKFLIENTGTVAASLSLDWKDLINTYTNGSLTYRLTYATEEDGEYVPIDEASVEGTNVPVSSTPIKQTMIGEISVPEGETHYYNLEITLNNLPDVNQNADLGATFQTMFDVDQPIGRRNYRLIINPNGGEWGETSGTSEFLLTHEGTKDIANPSRMGYSFAGWDVEGVGYELTGNTFKMGISDANLTAKWNAKKHIITIDGEERELAFGEEIDLGTPIRDGYSFIGWGVTGGTLFGNKFTLTSDEDVTITSNWMALSYDYTVVHRQMNVDGSGYEEVSRTTETAMLGEKVTPPVNSYTGFTSPDGKEITITENEGENIVTYDYRRNKYDITINPDGGTYSGATSFSDIYFGSTIELSTVSKTGYTFTKWIAPIGEVTGSSYVVGAGNATITANWEVNNYKYIVYHKQMNTDGVNYTTVEADTVKSQGAYGSSVTPPVKTYTGFTSPGVRSWTLGVDTDPPTKNLFEYLYGRQQYNLTIKPNGGIYEGKTTETVLSKYYQGTETLSDPTREGYTFKGWTNTGGTLNGSTFTMSDADHSSVEASWQVNQYDYKVYYRQMAIDGATYNVVSADTISTKADYGTTITPPLKSYTGFTSPTQGSMTIGVDTSKNIITYNYTRNQYTLTVNPGDGTYNKSTSVGVYFDDTYDLGTATKMGYNSSWQKVSGAGSLSGSTYTMGAGVAEVKAVYTPKTFEVTFNANGGTTSTSKKTVSYDSAYGDLPTPSYTGYSFLGWFTLASGGTKVTKDTVVKLSESQTLYAHWGESIVKKIIASSKGPLTTSFDLPESTTAGVYELSDDDGNTSYYFRGPVTNNYVKFGKWAKTGNSVEKAGKDMYWRIIRINGDGSIRMIYDGTSAHANNDQTSETFIATGQVFNSTNGDVKYVGYMYGPAGTTASTSRSKAISNVASSTIKGVLETWYENNLSSYDSYISKDAIFCYDRGLGGSDSTFTNQGYKKYSTNFAATSRLSYIAPDFIVANPTFKCSQAGDKFTAKDATKGNKVLKYPVGLITADEVVAAGSGKRGAGASSFYLSRTSWYWTGTPETFDINSAALHIMEGNRLSNLEVTSAASVAPVINLSSEYANTLIGTGTMTDYYREA